MQSTAPAANRAGTDEELRDVVLCHQKDQIADAPAVDRLARPNVQHTEAIRVQAVRNSTHRLWPP